jgi:hypothetical protein
MDVLKVVSLSLKQSVVRFSNLRGLIVISGEYISLSVLFSETPNSGGAKAPSRPCSNDSSVK